MEDDLNDFQMEEDINFELIFGMQHCFDPTSILFQMEDVLYFVKGNLGSLFLVCNLISTQLPIWNMEDNLEYLKMEENLYFWKWKTT